MNEGKLWSAGFVSMGLTNFVIFISHYSLIASMPVIVMDHLGGTELDTGLAMTFFQIGTVGFRPLAGLCIDSFNKRRLMFAALGVFLLTMLGYSLVQSLFGLYGLRVVHGLIFSLSTTAAAALAAMLLPTYCKARGIGYFALTTNLAMVIGPTLGLLVVGEFGMDGILVFLGVLGVLAMGLGNFKRLPDEIAQPVKKEHKGLKISDFIEKRAIGPSMFGSLIFFAYGGVLMLISIYTKSMGLQSETSLFFAVFAAVIVVTRPLVGYVFDKWGMNAGIYPGFVLFAIGMFLLGLASDLTGLLLTAVFLGCGFGILSPAFQTMAVQSAPVERSGVATATYFWSLDISVGLAASLLSILAGYIGYAAMYGIFSTSIIILTGIFYLLWQHDNSQKYKRLLRRRVRKAAKKIVDPRRYM